MSVRGHEQLVKQKLREFHAYFQTLGRLLTEITNGAVKGVFSTSTAACLHVFSAAATLAKIDKVLQTGRVATACVRAEGRTDRGHAVLTSVTNGQHGIPKLAEHTRQQKGCTQV